MVVHVFGLRPHPPRGLLVCAGRGRAPPPADEAVAEVLAAFDDPPADAAEQLDGFVRLLVEQGLLER